MMQEEWIRYNKLGLIPGPRESLDEFQTRVHYCLHLSADFSVMLEKEFGLKDVTLSSQPIQEATEITQSLYDIVPTWVPIIFSNHHLSPWQGGSAWIFQLNSDLSTGAFFQLREAFIHKKKYLGIYDRKELVAHESAHIGRMLFDEPKFEEILAYRTSKSRFRRYFGPIITSATESVLFILALFGSLFVTFAESAYTLKDSYFLLTSVRFLPIALLGIALGRLWARQKQFAKCLKALEAFLSKEVANAVIYRLTDEEIVSFGWMTPEEILAYATQQTENNIRWHIIHDVYLASAST